MNVTEVVFSGFYKTQICGLYQYDYGQMLKFTDITLPSTYEVHFAQSGASTTVTVLGDSNGVQIPDQYLLADLDIRAYIYLHEEETDGETVYQVLIPVIARPEPTDVEPTPVEQGIITQTIAALNSAVDTAEGYAADASQSASDSAASAISAQAWAEAAQESAESIDTSFFATKSALQSEENARALADTSLGNQIGAETQRATQAEASVRLAIPTKTSQLQNDSGYITNAPVASVNGKTGAVNLTASDVGALPSSTAIPSKTSDLTNDSGFLTQAVTSVNGQTGAVTISTATTSANGLMSSQDKENLDAVRGQIGDLKTALNNINGSQIKTNQIDYSILAVSENKKINGYNTSTYLPILADETGSVVADFAISDIRKYSEIRFPRCTKSNQWVIIYGSNQASKFTKNSIYVGTTIDLSNAEYGIIYPTKLNINTFSRIAIAFDLNVDITVDTQFGAFFDLMRVVKDNQYVSKDIREIYYSDTIEIDNAKTNVYIPFTVFNGETLTFTNNTNDSIALYLFDANNNRTTISTGFAANASVTFTADKDYERLLYWSQQTGSLTVTNDDSVIKRYHDDNIIAASVNMFESIGAIGDSYTAGSSRTSGGSWVDKRNLSWIATMGKRSGTEWKNYGHGGATTKTFLETTEFTNALSDTACDLYFFALGQNDGNQSLTIGTVADIHDDDYTQNADTFYGNYGRIIQQIKNHAPNAKLVMITNWVQGSTWTDYDVAIRAIASHYSIPVIEPFDDYFFNSELYQSYKEYGHPTAMGYSSMGIAMERLFSKCVVNNPSYFKFATIG